MEKYPYTTESTQLYSAQLTHYFNETLPETIKLIQTSEPLAGKPTSKQNVYDLIKLYDAMIPKLFEFISMIIESVKQSNDAMEGINNVIHYLLFNDDSESFKLNWGAKYSISKSVQLYLPSHNSMYLFFILYSICSFRKFSSQFPIIHKSGIETSEKILWTTLITRLEEDAIGKMFPVSLGKYGKGGDFIYQVLSHRFKSDKTIIAIISPDTANGVGHVGNMAAINFIQNELKTPVSIKVVDTTTRRLHTQPHKKTIGSRKESNPYHKTNKSHSTLQSTLRKTKHKLTGGTLKRHNKTNKTNKTNKSRRHKIINRL